MLVDETDAVVIPTEAYTFALSYSALQQSVADGSSGDTDHGKRRMWSLNDSVAIILLSPPMQDANLSSERFMAVVPAPASPFIQGAPQLASFPLSIYGYVRACAPGVVR